MNIVPRRSRVERRHLLKLGRNSGDPAAALGYPLAIPMVGGSLPGYARIAAIYRQAWQQSGRPAAEARIATFAHLHVAADAQRVRDDFYPYYSAYLRPLFKGPTPGPVFEQMLSTPGALVAGGPQEVIDKLMAQREAMGTTRFVGQIDIGGQPFAEVMKGVERFATQVAPVLRREATPLLPGDAQLA